jgi:hypothetical protein
MLRKEVATMTRTFALIVALLVASGSALAQKKEIRQAQAGESCEGKEAICSVLCLTNQITNPLPNQAICDGNCTRYGQICVKTGVWNDANKEIGGLPPK